MGSTGYKRTLRSRGATLAALFLNLAVHMVSERRRGKEQSETRAQLIAAANQLVATEGFSAVTARRLAQVLGLSHQIVHYYFKSMDDLLIEVVERGAEPLLEEIQRCRDSDDALKVVININSSFLSVLMGAEFTIFASRRPALREAVKRTIEQFRQVQTDVVLQHLKRHQLDKRLPAQVMTVIMTSVFRVFALEAAIGVTAGQVETLAWLSEMMAADLHMPPALGNPVL